MYIITVEILWYYYNVMSIKKKRKKKIKLNNSELRGEDTKIRFLKLNTTSLRTKSWTMKTNFLGIFLDVQSVPLRWHTWTRRGVPEAHGSLPDISVDINFFITCKKNSMSCNIGDFWLSPHPLLNLYFCKSSWS